MDGMMTAVNDLIATLRDEIRLQKDLFDLARAKREAIVRSDVAGMEAVTRREEKALYPIGEAGLKRMKLTEQLARTMAIDEKEVAIGAIARRLPEPSKGELQRLSGQLKRMIAEVGALNKTNNMLTEHAIVQVRDFLRILSGQSESDAVYTRKGLATGKQIYRVAIDQVA